MIIIIIIVIIIITIIITVTLHLSDVSHVTSTFVIHVFAQHLTHQWTTCMRLTCPPS